MRRTRGIGSRYDNGAMPWNSFDPRDPRNTLAYLAFFADDDERSSQRGGGNGGSGYGGCGCLALSIVAAAFFLLFVASLTK